jgi:Flp pilus assembly protein TadG
MKRSNLNRRNRLGAAVVEFAVVAPIFFMTLFASIELCRALMATHSLEEAARSACRVAVLKGATTSEIDAEVRRILSPVGITRYTMQIQPENIETEARWTPVSLTINTSFANISWLPLPGLLAAKTYTSTCTLPKEFSSEN